MYGELSSSIIQRRIYEKQRNKKNTCCYNVFGNDYNI